MQAYLFLWNPKHDTDSFENFDSICVDATLGRPYETLWICPSQQPQQGDIAYVQRTGIFQNGVFARGTVTTDTYEDEDGTRVVGLRLDSFLPLGSQISRASIVAASTYEKTWSPMASGNVIPTAILVALEQLWVQTISEKVSVESGVVGENASAIENTVDETDGGDWYSESDYRQALIRLTESITPVQRRMLVAHAEASDCILSVRQLAAAGGYDNPNVTYSQYGRLAHLIANSLGEKEPWKVWTYFIGQGIRTEDNELIWEMHPELVAALVSLGWASRELTSLEDITDTADVAGQSTLETIRTAIVQARIGQGPFRIALVHYWGKCAVSGVSEPAVLRASHIKPWKDAADEERLDPNNGLLLAAHIDALFDKGLITFEVDGQIRFSPLMANEDLLRLGISNSMRLRRITTEHEKYMQYHRNAVFRTGIAPGPH